MNAPAKRFSLQRLLTSPAPESAPAAAPAPAPAVLVAPEPSASLPAAAPAALELPTLPPIPPLPAAPVAPSRAPKAVAAEEAHPKKKRSYSVDMKLCEDLETLAWYQGRSSSSVVEELIRKHLQHQRAVLFKAREVQAAR